MIVYLGLGSNIEPNNNIAKAKEVLVSRFDEVRFSRTFESEAIGFEGDKFLNLVAEVQTEEPLETLMISIKCIENELGRVQGQEKFSSRCIDIDILLYGDYCGETPLQLPRDEIKGNAYVLWPLAELAPDLVEPGGELSYLELWQNFDKASQQLEPIDS